ncbi:MAG: hypothetical protein ABSA46_16280 [Thermodesulfovibrionales bacterium]|jgi:hypothetical protein
MRPIVEESLQKRREIVRNGSEVKEALKGRLQEFRWSTDMRIGKILTEE